mgnify:FL=1|tara:strand:+ start:76183 stop:76665 length:483 start_codon:yes stop_codon:yes gene_type:complete
MANALGAIFDLGPAISQTKKALSIHDSLILDMVNWRPWVEAELRLILEPMNPMSYWEEKEYEEAQFGDMGFPTDNIERARKVMRNLLTEMVANALGPVRDHHLYEVEFLDVDAAGAVYNLKIIDRGDRRALEYERHLKEEAMFEEAGGYVPERMRSAYSY